MTWRPGQWAEEVLKSGGRRPVAFRRRGPSWVTSMGTLTDEKPRDTSIAVHTCSSAKSEKCPRTGTMCLWGPRGSAAVWDSAGLRWRARWKELGAVQRRRLARVRSMASPHGHIRYRITRCAGMSCQCTAPRNGTDVRVLPASAPRRAPAGRRLPDDPDPLACPHRTRHSPLWR